MARYTKEHKQVTRQRIIETAGHRFKKDGIDGSGISTLMADAGLTNGAFYAHFESKDDLVANVIAEQLRTQVEQYDALRPGREGLEDLIRAYLSPQHRDNPGDGCPSAALLDEIGRCGDETKDAYTDGAKAILEELAARLAPEDPQSARGQAIAAAAAQAPAAGPGRRSRRAGHRTPFTPPDPAGSLGPAVRAARSDQPGDRRASGT